ncbi:hypothetical protein Desca_2400 [Desulfotomaculum nigrificans CO-1-SRB]|uniref:Sporulation protein YjcZ n=1 Tax=Desulfotomaculum nigrificans (strain DSM 14880 / VKM B-2319 / CO-1-SRB) TaxID=868595 RepID=F6B3S1_DESCC|nr:hypothetical protein Desca_2400 [Desulfotomaculum nigrificans CO-1-SRB]
MGDYCGGGYGFGNNFAFIIFLILILLIFGNRFGTYNA